ncbi:cytochrome b-c1 complex subunit 7-like [Neocloeon triangulifer]|uniref:cytochrome b-c1 complex subunit 7-like n=1 Tax=Neocloeon triangulifer TaxID=2078957 RepID=UPI00286ED585|nr:cytochrome b-c1 complex subunit 7-like [Neocloeon triangulifer]
MANCRLTAYFNKFPGLKKWAYNLSGFNKYGLHKDDVLDESNPDVVEALRRLPEHLKDERTFRIVRAMQLSLQKAYLPQEEWTKFEEDKKYLQPYLQEVIQERLEKEEWNKNI